jgi:hypothetical protein
MGLTTFLLQALTFANIAVYAASYAVTKEQIASLAKVHAADLEAFADYITHAGLLGMLIIGIVADKVSARASVNITNLASIAIYTAAYVLHTGSSVPFAGHVLRLGTMFQHTMIATAMFACIRAGPASGSPALIALLQVSLGYSFGQHVVARYLTVLPVAQQLVFGISATAACVVASHLVPSPVAVVYGRTATGATKAYLAPGSRRSLVSIVAGSIPTLFFIAAVRFGRVMLQNSRVLLEKGVGPEPAWQSWPVPVDSLAPIASNAFIVPGLLIFCRGPATVLGVVLATGLAGRAALVCAPAALTKPRDAQLFYLVLTAVSGLLYNLPTAFVGIYAEIGTRGRVLAMQAALSSLIMQHGAQLRDLALEYGAKYAPTVTNLSLSENELDFAVTAIALGIALVHVPSIALAGREPPIYTAPSAPTATGGKATRRRAPSDDRTSVTARIDQERSVNMPAPAATKPTLKPAAPSAKKQ